VGIVKYAAETSEGVTELDTWRFERAISGG
jgi:hypothetical protein